MGIILLITIFVLSGCGKTTTNQTSEKKPTLTPVPTKPIEESIKERPYLSLIPTSDGHRVDFSVKRTGKGSTGVDYELTYFADLEGGKIERGVSSGGVAAKLTGNEEYSNRILFGTESCTNGCKYKYDENVSEGTVSIKIAGGSLEKYSTVFRLQKGIEAKDGLTTGDGVFEFLGTLPTAGFYITTSTIGVPADLPQTVTAKSLPYAVFPSTGIKGTVLFKTSETTGKIMLYDGSSWNSLDTAFSAGKASAATSKGGIFIFVK